MYKCNTSVSKMFMQVAGLFCLVLNQQILWIQRHLKVPIARFGFNSTLYYSSKFYLVYISMKNMKNKHFLGHKIEFHRWIHLAQQQPIQWKKLISSLRICTYHESFKLIKHNVFLVIPSLKICKNYLLDSNAHYCPITYYLAYYFEYELYERPILVIR